MEAFSVIIDRVKYVEGIIPAVSGNGDQDEASNGV